MIDPERTQETATGTQLTLEGQMMELITRAVIEGKVITICTEPLLPLSAGHYYMRGEVRDSHAIMRAKMVFDEQRKLEKQALFGVRYGQSDMGGAAMRQVKANFLTAAGLEPVPPDVVFNESLQVFFRNAISCGSEFHAKWWDRRHEFPVMGPEHNI